MIQRIRRIPRIVVAGAAATLFLVPVVANASNTPTLNQTVNNGSLSTNIYQSDDATPVSSPSVSFNAVNASFTCQTTTATLGDSGNKVNVTNLDTVGSHSGWTLSMAATSGAGATWSDGSGHTYSVDNAAGSGCTGGQMTINPSVATLTADCNSVCTNTHVTLGSSTSLASGGTDAATLMSDSDYNPWEGYLTGISLSQKIPPQQIAGSYSLNMTITVTAN